VDAPRSFRAPQGDGEVIAPAGKKKFLKTFLICSFRLYGFALLHEPYVVYFILLPVIPIFLGYFGFLTLFRQILVSPL